MAMTQMPTIRDSDSLGLAYDRKGRRQKKKNNK